MHPRRGLASDLAVKLRSALRVLGHLRTLAEVRAAVACSCVCLYICVYVCVFVCVLCVWMCVCVNHCPDMRYAMQDRSARLEAAMDDLRTILTTRQAAQARLRDASTLQRPMLLRASALFELARCESCSVNDARARRGLRSMRYGFTGARWTPRWLRRRRAGAGGGARAQRARNGGTALRTFASMCYFDTYRFSFDRLREHASPSLCCLRLRTAL